MSPDDAPTGARVTLADLSPSLQSYLMAIHSLAAAGESVSSSALADRLGASPSSITEAVRKLVALGLAEHEPYAPIALSAAGDVLAVAMVRRHRLIETFLAGSLGYSWDEVHAEADVLEHVVSDRFVDALDVYLGHPTRDPHGDPIPTADGRVADAGDERLDVLAEGSRGVVSRVSDRDPRVLRYLDRVGLRPDVTIVVRERSVELGTCSVEVDGAAVDMGLPAAAAVRVRIEGPR